MKKKQTFLIVALVIILGFCICIIFGLLLQNSENVANIPPTDNEALPQALIETPSPTETAMQTISPCILASQAQFDVVQGGLDSIDDGVYIQTVYAVQSGEGYFLAADLYGPGLDGSIPGVWFVFGSADNPEIILSVDHVAAEFTNYPLGSTTDFGIDMTFDDAKTAENCALND